jgi:hypothetical protein
MQRHFQTQALLARRMNAHLLKQRRPLTKSASRRFFSSLAGDSAYSANAAAWGQSVLLSS